MTKFASLAKLHDKQPDTKLSGVALADIRIDGGTQARESINQRVVSEYAEVLRNGGSLPSIIIYFDGSSHWLADGFHRYFAHQHLGLERVEAEVRQGTQRDAVLHAAGANDKHGLRRSPADKRRAVKMLLADPEWAAWSNAEIARRCAVDDKTVASVRQELGSDAGVRKASRGGKTYTVQTTRLKRGKSSSLKTSLTAFRKVLEHTSEAELKQCQKQLADLQQELGQKLAHL
jgi:ParB-like chromosome segregation protein Spo0J